MLNLPVNEIIYSKPLIREINQNVVDELKNSFQQHDLLQPITVFINEDKVYEVIFGNHRLKAVKELGWTKIPAIIRNAKRNEAKILALIENIQRHPMNPIKEGEIFNSLIQNEKQTVESLSKLICKNKIYIENRILLYTNLLPKLRKEVGQSLTITNAIMLAKLLPKEQKIIYKRILNRNKIRAEKVDLPVATTKSDHICTCPICNAKHLRGVSIDS